MHPFHTLISKALLIIASLMALFLSSEGESQQWQMLDGVLQAVDGHGRDRKSMRSQPLLSEDLNNDGRAECLILKEETAQITDCSSRIFWQSPSDWRVTEAQTGDLNRDGVDEAILLVWRAFRPWPVDNFLPNGGRIKEFHDQNGESCQIILIGWSRDDWRELWAGSALARPVEQLGVADLDGDGWQELAALERPYDTKRPNTDITVWKWLGFGFTLIDRVKGAFYDLSIFRDSSQNWLLTQ